ncbi:MAG: protein translocase subunit SecF, partial [Planctomycetia bacterium]|nr:protein translocase subunit SecF [Planctomycetia bacterium]
QTTETNPAPVTETPATPAEPAPVLTGAPTESNVAELPTQLDLSTKQTTVTLHFEEAITGESVSSLVAAKLDAMEKRGVLFDVVAPEAEENARRFHDWTIHIDLPAEEVTPIFAEIQKDVNTTPVFPSCTTIGSQVASSTCLQGLVALMASLLGIIAYIWIRFQKVSYGLASCAGLVHNVVIALGLIAISTWIVPVTGWLMITDFKISLTILAAFLTLIGYSLNDTIIVFDRIREVRGKDPQLTKEVINKSLNQTLARTIMTSLTTFIVSVALYIWGGQTIHGFAFVMTSGIIIGTYASLFVATPLLYWMVGKYGSDD